jgi:hypothetical protein
MANRSKVPPRFVPTLTDVVPDSVLKMTQWATSEKSLPAPGQDVWAHEGMLAQAAVPDGASPAQRMDDEDVVAENEEPGEGVDAAAPPVSEEFLVHQIMQRVDIVLDQRLREAIATVVQEQTRSIVVRLREEVESVVRQAVYEAVADELTQSVQPAESVQPVAVTQDP